MDLLLKYWAPIWAAATVIVMVTMAMMGRTYAKRDDLIALDSRVERLDDKVKELPSARELHGLQLEISDLRGDLKELKPELRQVSRLSDLLLENELKVKENA